MARLGGGAACGKMRYNSAALSRGGNSRNTDAMHRRRLGTARMSSKHCESLCPAALDSQHDKA